MNIQMHEFIIFENDIFSMRFGFIFSTKSAIPANSERRSQCARINGNHQAKNNENGREKKNKMKIKKNERSFDITASLGCRKRAA